MGTENEALRWKQWIDRLGKVAAVTKSDSSIATFALNVPKSPIVLDSANVGARKSLLTPEQLQYQLVNMIKVRTVLYDFLKRCRRVTQFFVKACVASY